MNIPVDEQLEAYTTWKVGALLAKNGLGFDENSLSVSDGRDLRSIWTFTYEELVDYLRAHPRLVDSYLAKSQKMVGYYDHEILVQENGKNILYWQDHHCRRDERLYDDLFEAAADWLTVQYGMWLHE